MKDISRRKFLKYLGYGATGSLIMSACKSDDKDDSSKSNGEIITDGQMTYRVNPNTGDKVSLLGYGCMRLPTVGGQSAQRSDEEIDQQKVNEQVDFCLEHGVNYFDTSPAYCRGMSEKVMGEALCRHPRNTYYLATKLSNFNPATWSRESSIEMFENSLKNLKTDYIDYLLLHSVGGKSDELDSMQTYRARYEDNGILDWLIEQRKIGRIRNLGFSYHGDVKIFDYMLRMMDEGRLKWDFAQIQHNYVDLEYASEINPVNTKSVYLLGELAKRGIPAVVMEPLLGGRLADVPLHIAARMKALRPNNSVASWAFRFAGTSPAILTVLSGMTYDEHIRDNIRTFSPLEPISSKEEEFLRDAAKKIVFNKSIPCTGCSYCMPCPYGVDIPAVFEHYNKCINDDNLPQGPNHDAAYKSARRRFLGRYHIAVDSSRNASRCIGCNHCVSHCPQTIDIPATMHEIDDYVTRLKAEV